jgi:hypothetical protein
MLFVSLEVERAFRGILARADEKGNRRGPSPDSELLRTLAEDSESYLSLPSS